MPPTAGVTHDLTLTASGTTRGFMLARSGEDPFDTSRPPRGFNWRDASQFAARVVASGEGGTDLQLPFQHHGHRDWSGGMGERDFQTRNKFWSSENVDTRIPQQAILSPFRMLGFDQDDGEPVEAAPSGTFSISGAAADSGAAVSWTPSENFTSWEGCWLWLRTTQTSAVTVRVRLHSNSAGVPGTVLDTVTLVTVQPYWSWVDVGFTGAQNLVSGTQYWISVDTVSAGAVLWAHAGTTGGTSASHNGTSWSAGTIRFFFIQDPAANSEMAVFASGELFYGGLDFTGSGTRRFFVAADDRVMYLDTSDGLLKNSRTGFTTITGILEFDQRLIVADNGGTDSLWHFTNATTTTVWTQVTQQAKYLAKGGGNLWVARGNHQVARTSDLAAFSANIPVGDSGANVNGMAWWGGRLWCGKDDGLYVVEADVAYQVLDYESQFDTRNFRAMVVGADGALYYNVRSSLYRWTQTGQPSVIDAALSTGFAGTDRGAPLSALVLSNYLIVAYDTSSATSDLILVYDYRGGWHFLVRTRNASTGRGLALSTVTSIDRLWYQDGPVMGFVYWPSDTENPLKDSNMLFEPRGRLNLSRFSGDVPEVQKYAKSVDMFGDNIDANDSIDAIYNTNAQDEDPQTSGTTLGTFDAGPNETLEFSAASGGTTFRTFDLLDQFTTHNLDETPKLTSQSLKFIARPVVTYEYSADVLIADGHELRLRSGMYDETTTATQLYDFLRVLRNTKGTISAVDSWGDTLNGIVTGVSFQALGGNQDDYRAAQGFKGIARITFYDPSETN